MNEFILTEEALAYEKEMLGKTTLVHAGGDLVAYYTLSNNALRLDDENLMMGPRLDELPVRDIPAVFVGRIAVDRKWKRRGIGTHIINETVAYAAECSSQRCAIRLILLHAKKGAFRFYEQLDFSYLPLTGKERSRLSRQGMRTMYLDLKAILEEPK